MMFSALAILLLVGPSLQFTSFQQGELKKHNEYRALHGVPPLTLDAQLCEWAQNWADHLAKTGHNPQQNPHNPDSKGKYGENIAWHKGSYPLATGETTKRWYDEIKNYNFNNPGPSGASGMIGHFTQVVWKSSTKFCIAKATKGRDTWIVANYSPRGNMMGQIADNVLPKGRAATQRQQFTSFQQGELKKHNEHRALHGAPAMTLDAQACKQAQNWANHLAKTGKFSHSGVQGYGENLYMTSGSYATGSATKDWYDEIKHYNFKNPGFSMKTGHFTQLVWKSSTKFCIAKATGSQGTVVVANYSPAGNMMGDFPNNVLPKGRAATQERNLRDTLSEDEVREVFRKFDRDNNGLISEEEVWSFISELGYNPTEKEVNEIREKIRISDTDGDGQINFEEFLKIKDPIQIGQRGRGFTQGRKLMEKLSEDKIRELFRLIDKDNDGLISEGDALSYFNEPGVTVEIVNQLLAAIRKCDPQNDGGVTWGQIKYEECVFAN